LLARPSGVCARVDCAHERRHAAGADGGACRHAQTVLQYTRCSARRPGPAAPASRVTRGQRRPRHARTARLARLGLGPANAPRLTHALGSARIRSAGGACVCEDPLRGKLFRASSTRATAGYTPRARRSSARPLRPLIMRQQMAPGGCASCTSDRVPAGTNGAVMEERGYIGTGVRGVRAQHSSALRTRTLWTARSTAPLCTHPRLFLLLHAATDRHRMTTYASGLQHNVRPSLSAFCTCAANALSYTC